MKVKELIRLLQEVDGELEVVVKGESGDECLEFDPLTIEVEEDIVVINAVEADPDFGFDEDEEEEEGEEG